MWHGHQKEKKINPQEAIGVRGIIHFITAPVSLMILVVVISITGIVLTSSISLAKPAGDMTPTESAKSWIYYNSLSACIDNLGVQLNDSSNLWLGFRNDRISASNASSGKWFNNPTVGATNPTIGYFLKGSGSSLSTSSDGEKVGCGGNDVGWILDAAKLWGYSNGVDALCDFGAKRVDVSDCRDGHGDFTGESFLGHKLSIDKFRSAIKNKVYSGKDPNLPDAAKYILYRDAFFSGCIGSSNPSAYTGNASASDPYLYTIKLVDSSGSNSTSTKYYGNKKQGDKISFYVDSGLNNVSDTCSNIANVINQTANAYKKAAASTDNGDTGSNGSDTGSASSCSIPGVGWIICPVVRFGAWIADGAFKLLADNFLSTSTSIFTANNSDGVNPTFEAWSAMRSIANVAFVIAFLIIIFSQITSVGITNYGIKKMLPRLIIAAILVNLSYYVCQIAVDLSNILGYSLKSFLSGLAPGVVNPGPGYTWSGGNTWTDTAGVLLVAGTATAIWGSLAVLIPALLAAIVALVMILFILVARQALIILLIVISPLAFVAFLLPNTSDWFKKWQKAFTAMLMLFPIIAVVFGASSFASIVLKQVFGSSDSAPLMGEIVSAVILVVPLFVVPGLLKKSLDGVGSIGTKMNGWSDKWGKGAGDKYKGSAFNKYREGVAAEKSARISAGNYKGAGGKLNLNNWRSRGNRALNKWGAFNAVSGGFGAHRDLSAQSQDFKDIKEAQGIFGGDDDLMAEWANTGGDASQLGKHGITLNDTQREQFNRLRQAGHQNKSTSFFAAAQGLSEGGKSNAGVINKALENAKRAGASDIDISGAKLSAGAAYRKSGRGDALAELQGKTQSEGWAQVSAKDVNREGIGKVRTQLPDGSYTDVMVDSEGAISYSNYLQDPTLGPAGKAKGIENTRKALEGFGGMEARAQGLAEEHILAAAKKFYPNVTDIKEAKQAFGVK